MSDTTATESTAENATESGEGKQTDEQKFTQADIDKAVRERIARERAKFADYDDLKAKAEGAKTVEQKLAELEKKTADAEARALRSDIAARFQISAEDRDLFLTGTDEETLTAQATRLSEREADRKKQGNVAPKEGTTTTSGNSDADTKQFLSQLTGAS